MYYFKRAWNESRGDEYDYWGSSIWYFEVGKDGFVTRQIEIYENGQALAYDEKQFDDKFGMLSDKPLDLAEFSQYTIHKEEFEKIWLKIFSKDK